MERVADLLKRLDAFHIALQGLASRTGPRAADGIRGRCDRSFHRKLVDLMMVRSDDVDHICGHAVTFGDIRADLRVRALHLVAHRLADVVQQRAHLRDLNVRAHLGCQHGSDMGSFDRVIELILAVARAIFQPAQQFDDLWVQHLQTRFDDRLLARVFDRLLDLTTRFFDFLLNARGMDAPVLHQATDGNSRNFAAHRIERGDQDRFRRVVHHQVHAGGLLDGADVAPLPADDAPLHLVGRQRHASHGRL